MTRILSSVALLGIGAVAGIYAFKHKDQLEEKSKEAVDKLVEIEHSMIERLNTLEKEMYAKYQQNKLVSNENA